MTQILPLPPASTRRGVGSSDVERAADALLREGARPTVERVRKHLGTGSPNTINPLLDAWWRRLSGRLGGEPAALERLPEAIAHAAEAMWWQALEESRRRVLAEEAHGERRLLAAEREHSVRERVLELREKEFESRLAAERLQLDTARAEVRALTKLLREEQAKGAWLEATLKRRQAPVRRPSKARAPKPPTRRPKKPKPVQAPRGRSAGRPRIRKDKQTTRRGESRRVKRKA